MQEELQKELNKIWGNWEIKKFLGEGSFGQVYQIEKKEFDYTYKAALKVITIPKSQDEVAAVLNELADEGSVTEYYHEIVSDIVKEIVLMSKLKGNTNIVSYEDHAVIPHENGIGWNIYIRMELLTPLFQYTKENQLAVRDVIKLGIDMCKAVEICQKYNIIHRDIKPENIFVSEMGDYKLGDFGISRQMEKTALEFSKKGTYSYMAPEVYKGKKYNSTVDIYSLGIVLYRFLNNNRLPFLPDYPNKISYSDRNKALIMRTSGEELPKPCNAEGRLAEIVLKACAYDPKARYESAVDMRRALEAILYEQSMTEVVYPEGDILYRGMEDERSIMQTHTEEVSVTAPIEKTADDEETVCLFPGEEDNDDIPKEDIQSEEPEQLEEDVQPENLEEISEKVLYSKKPEKIIEEQESKEPQLGLSNEEEFKEEKKQHNLPVKKIAVGAAVVAIIAAIGIRSTLAKAEVPNVINMTVSQAEKKGSDFHIVQADAKYSDKVKRGNIISQKVQAGTKLKKGEKIPVIVSKGSQVIVPQVTGMKKEDGQKLLESKKLHLNILKEEYSDKVKKGCIISQSVKSGEKADEETKISVVVSKGVEQVKVPNVIGNKKQNAIKKIKKAGLKYSISSEYSSSVSEGRIISQKVKAGKYVDKGKEIKLKVSIGKKPQSTQEYEPVSTRETSTTRHITTTERKNPTTSTQRPKDNIKKWKLKN